jgi:hypothetical protein
VPVPQDDRSPIVRRQPVQQFLDGVEPRGAGSPLRAEDRHRAASARRQVIPRHQAKMPATHPVNTIVQGNCQQPGGELAPDRMISGVYKPG